MSWRIFSAVMALLVAAGSQKGLAQQVLAEDPLKSLPGTDSAEVAGSGMPSVEDADIVALGLVPGRPLVRPLRTETPPAIDGVLDDPVWRTAAVITEFTQPAPAEGAPATEAIRDDRERDLEDPQQDLLIRQHQTNERVREVQLQQ